MPDPASPHSALATRLILSLGGAYLVAAAVLVVLVNLHDRNAAREEARHRAHLLVERNLAIHRFINRELKPALFEVMEAAQAPRRFDPRWMSSNYVVRRIDETAREESVEGEEYYYKESAIDARSPSNEADPYERAFIEDARKDPALEFRTGVRVLAGRAYLEVLHRGEVMDASCLRCHSVPSAAPPGLVERYGAARSFGRKLGDLVSAISVRVPLEGAYAEANASSLRLSAALLAVLAALLGVHVVLQRRLVLAPLARLRAAEAARREEQLESQVAHRTAALVAANAELERTLREREQARKAEALGRLAGGAAHEFNNVLTAIRGYAGLLLDGLPPGDPRREDLLELQRAGERGNTLTRQLHAFGRRDPGAPRLVDPNRLVTHVEEMVRRLLPERVALEVDLAPGAGPVRVDPAQLEQVVVNLAVNARDAMPEGGRIVIRTRNVDAPGPEAPAGLVAPGRWLVLSVADDGPGLDPESLENVFEPFFVARGRDAATGLGLAAVQAIARQCGGLATAETSAGLGTTFRVWLPVGQGAVEGG
jgi:signal transduction histidine kinase